MGSLASSLPGPALWRPASTTCWWGIARRASFQDDRDRTDVRRPGGGLGGGQGRDHGGSPRGGGSSSPCAPGPQWSGGRSRAGWHGACDCGELRLARSGGGPLTPPPAFGAFLATLRTEAWVVCVNPPFGGPELVLQVPGAVHAPGGHPSPRVDYPAFGGYASAALPQEGDLVGCGVVR